MPSKQACILASSVLNGLAIPHSAFLELPRFSSPMIFQKEVEEMRCYAFILRRQYFRATASSDRHDAFNVGGTGHEKLLSIQAFQVRYARRHAVRCADYFQGSLTFALKGITTSFAAHWHAAASFSFDFLFRYGSPPLRCMLDIQSLNISRVIPLAEVALGISLRAT